MSQQDNSPEKPASVEEIQQSWHQLNLRVGQLEAEEAALQLENKSLRSLLERVVEHRQKSHSELIMLLTGLVSKLPMNDVGFVVSKLVEHNAHVCEILTALLKGKPGEDLPQPAILKALEQTKTDLMAALKPAVDELIQMNTPLDTVMLKTLVENPDLFYSPEVVRATRCYVKGQLPRERVVAEFGEGAQAYFNDLTTDPKFNPRPKLEEIVLSFKPDFEVLIKEDSTLSPEKRKELTALYQKVQRSREGAEQYAQKAVFLRMTFILELLHYYDNQNTEAVDAIFAQRLPPLIEQLVVANEQDVYVLDEKLIEQAESLLSFIIKPEHRQMIINNTGKGGGAARTMKFVMTLRNEKDKVSDLDMVIQEFIKHLILPPPVRPQPPEVLAKIIRQTHPDNQKAMVLAIIETDRIRQKESAELGRAIAKELGLKGLEEELKVELNISPETERQMAWEKIKGLIMGKSSPGAIATAIRDRLHAKYDSDEVKQSWITLTETDPMTLIRTFCQLPYLQDGSTDPIARAVMETYVTRLMHEKYVSTYSKIVGQLKNIFKVKADSPTLLNFVALVKWVDPESAEKLSTDIGMHAAAHA